MDDFVSRYKAVLESLREMPDGRAKALAIRKLEESAFWASCALRNISSGIEYAESLKPKTPKPPARA